MEKRIVLWGFAVGSIGGLLAAIFARIFSEPIVQRAIDYEGGREHAEAALDHGAHAHEAELFSRGIQSSVGLGLGMLVFGAAMGGLFAVAYALVARRAGSVRPRVLSLLVAGGAFLALCLVPFLKYPANPPSIGHADTIQARTTLYVAMVVVSVLALSAALLAGRRLSRRWGSWNATLLAGAGFAVVVAAAMALLPSPGDLHANVVAFGHQASETPLPLKDAAGRIVYPGFPADDLFHFRLYAIAGQLILWATIGLAFGRVAEQLLGHAEPARERGRLASDARHELA